MHPRGVSPLFAVLVALSMAWTGALASEPAGKAKSLEKAEHPDKAQAAPETPQAEDVGGEPETTLKQGMSAETVRKIMGDPFKIRPMEAPSGKAEVWVYQRRIMEKVEPVQVSAEAITVPLQAGGEVTHFIPEYRMQRHFTEVTIELLMYNGQYITQKISRQERHEFD